MMFRNFSRVIALGVVSLSLASCVQGFKAGHGVYITSVKISSMPKPGAVVPALVKMPQQSAPANTGAVVASAAHPVAVQSVAVQ